MMKHKAYSRNFELKEIESFLKAPKSGFVYIRGRRRVGKSWLLQELKQQHSTVVFYYSGKDDLTRSLTFTEFANEWDSFTGKPVLSLLKPELLTWKKIFEEILNYSIQQERICLIFDEIQWIAKEKTGFCGSLKEAWLSWEKTGKIKVILCGSSNRFFHTKTGGEEQILRGLTTHAPIWINPIPLRGIKEVFFPRWNDQEIAFVYFLTGGIPYYLNQIEDKYGFVHGINETFFKRTTLFLNEVNEILRLDFNKAGVESVKEVLQALTSAGSVTEVERKTGLPHATVSSIFEKLIDYSLIEERGLIFKETAKKPQKKYSIKDFYLNFYFKILSPLKRAIGSNTRRLLFAEMVLKSKDFYYVENFSGTAFEHLVKYVLEQTYVELEHLPAIFEKLKLGDANFSVFTYSDRTQQIDLVVVQNQDRMIRILECKWGKENLNWIKELKAKTYPIKSQETLNYYLVTGYPVSKVFQKKAEEESVVVISLRDLF